MNSNTRYRLATQGLVSKQVPDFKRLADLQRQHFYRETQELLFYKRPYRPLALHQPTNIRMVHKIEANVKRLTLSTVKSVNSVTSTGTSYY